MKIYTLILFFYFLASCGLKEQFEKVDKINADLTETFGHKDINTTLKWGTDEKDNYVIVLFYNFNINSTPYTQLDSLASKVRQRVVEHNPELKNTNNIEIQFTKENNTENINNYVAFKYRDTQGK